MRSKPACWVPCLVWFFTGCYVSGGQSGTEAIDVIGKHRPDAGSVPSDGATPPIPSTDASAPTPDASGSGVSPGDGDAAIASEPFDLEIDFYLEPCSGYEGQLWCYRLSQGGEPFALSYEPLSIAGYEWGVRGTARAHWEPVANPGLDAPPSNLVFDEGPRYEPVAAGTRFTIDLPEAVPVARVELNDDGAGGSLFNGPSFTCTKHLCETLAEAIATPELRSALVFEFDAQQRLSLVQVSPAEPYQRDPHASADVDALRDSWRENAPTSYVVKTCDIGFSVPACTLAAIDQGAVVAQEVGIPPNWTVSDAADFEDPLETLFEAAFTAPYTPEGQLPTWYYEVDEMWGYVSGTYYSGLESGGTVVQCFIPNSTDLEDCRSLQL